jgi:hypothetical protein
VLTTSTQSQKNRVLIVDTKTEKVVKTLNCLSPAYLPIALKWTPDLNGNKVPEFSIVGVGRTSGKGRVDIVDLSTKKILKTTHFSSPFTPKALATADIDNDSLAELSVLETKQGAEGKSRIEIREALSGTLIKTIPIPKQGRGEKNGEKS